MSNITKNLNDALAALNNNDLKRAEELFKRVIKIDKSNIPALNLLVVVLMRMERFAEAEPFIARATSLNQKSDVSFYNYGLISKRLNKPQQALENFSKALSLNSNVAETWNNRGTVFNDLKKYELAIADFDKAISLRSIFGEPYANKGKSLARLKRFDEAFAAYDKALSIKPDLTEAWLGRGDVFWFLNRFDEAFAAYKKALSIKRDLIEAWLSGGDVFSNLKRYDEAFAAYDKALLIKPDLAEAWLGRGNLFWSLKRFDEACAAYDKALSTKPGLEGAWLGRGNVFSHLKRYDEAVAAYDKALSIKPDLAEAWLGHGNVFRRLERYDEALIAFDKALSVKPDLEGAWLGRAYVFRRLERYDEALAAFDKALLIKPDLEGVEAQRIGTKMRLCKWENLDTEINRLIASVRVGKANCNPFLFLSLVESPDEHLHCAQAWTAAKYPQASESSWRGSIYTHDKIRIGYVSADFREHAVAYLVAELFECHDRTKFTTTAFSLASDDKSDMRQRLSNSFGAFIDCRNLPDADVARTIADAEIDILVDLNGFTRDARTDIFSHRPAPIQVNYLGYPGTMGAPYIDYIIGDKSLFTLADATAYSEKLVQLPHSYQPNDRKRHISDNDFSREQCGLPKDKFVFCCFNNTYKITPVIFDVWMRLLRAVPESVLWLSKPNATAEVNLGKEAELRGVSRERIIFAPRLAEMSGHLARVRQADLFLDTLPYNAHATASDALWAGLPVLTCLGASFTGRVAASLLKAVGLPELIATSLEEYEGLALKLAGDPVLLATIRKKLARNRDTHPLFDTPLYTKHLEAAYEAMYQRHKTGLPPDHIRIDP